MINVLDRVLRAGEGKKVKRLAELVGYVNELEPEMEALSDEELSGKTVEFRERLSNGESLDDLLIEAYAVVREAAWRVLGQRHFDVQIMGGMALHFGWIAEMKTGEGKTLASTPPAYLNALAGKGVHVVTVNDYLARRDSEWMGQLYNFLGLSVGRVSPDAQDFDDKKSAYGCDITYGTNTELGFDYLRDNMARSRETMVQRGFAYAIVDEVDSILIDEARTPLIISGPAMDSAQLYYQFANLARTLKADIDYEVDEEKRIVVPTESGIEKVEKQVGLDNLYDSIAVNYVHHLTQALRAKELYHRDKDYLVADGEVKIVDEFTGRVLEGRRWSDGLHQAVEAKERVRIKEENHTWATVTLQNYFRMYEKLAGMTGTASSEAAEFANTYGMQVVSIPTNEPMVRVDQPDIIYKTEDAKFAAVADDIAIRHEKGQPVLVGTASVAKSEKLARVLESRGIPHQVLNAKHHAREADIVVQAGRLASVTVATNMAGRGVDILLGGNPEGLAAREVAARGISVDSDEYGALYDEYLKKYKQACTAEGDIVRQAGGLYVLGSERHESRRIDDQLRGRSGRQGDPGESRFYLSLEDDLMRLFATGAMQWVMERALPEDVPIEARMVTKAIEKAQRNVEQRNAEIRKDVLKYDEVLNEQRKVIYARRIQVIDNEDLKEFTRGLLEDTVLALVERYCPGDFQEEWDTEGLVAELGQYYPTEFHPDDLAAARHSTHLAESLVAEALQYYESRDNIFPGGADDSRSVEREVMLQMIDQHWKDHLMEMDYLREGINLRAMGQLDPLVAWQADGYEMFGQMMDRINDDYLRYVLHVDAVEGMEEEPDLAQVSYQAAGGPAQELDSLSQSLAYVNQGMLAANITAPFAGALDQQPARVGGDVEGGLWVDGGAGTGLTRGVVAGGGGMPGGAHGRTDGSGEGSPSGRDGRGGGGGKDAKTKLGRNDPCWCGSNKKYKFCHGAG